MIVLYTDFGTNGPYVGQLQGAIYRYSPEARVVNLFADAPTFNPRAAAYLLAAYVDDFPINSVFLCVVDPGVGTTARDPVVVEADGRRYVGPDNGLFDVVAAQSAVEAVKRRVLWQPPRLCASFHGRDLFAPVAALLDSGEVPAGWLAEPEPKLCRDTDVNLDEVIYVDGFGNALSGRKAASVGAEARVRVAGRVLERRRTFGDVGIGEAFWYENANGLVEVAVNQGSAARVFNLKIGDSIRWS